MAVITIYFDVTYDESIIDPETVTTMLEELLDNAMSTPGVLDEINPNLEVGVWECEDA